MVLPETSLTDPYDQEAKGLLKALQSGLDELAFRVADKLYSDLANQDNTSRVLNRLLPDELAHVKKRQAEHMVMLLSDELTRETHVANARNVGLIHALVGVEILWLIESYNQYQDQLHRFLYARMPDSDSRDRLMQVISQRVLLDLECQVVSYQNANTEITSAFIKLDMLVTSTSNLNDLVQHALDIIGSLSGNISAFFARVDEKGQLQIEQSYGAAADQYHQAMETGTVPKINIDPSMPSGQGPGGKAWRSGEIVISDAWLIESKNAPWREIGRELGFRSSAAVPLLDESGRSIAMLSLYSGWPGFFSTDRVRGFFSHVQRMLSHAIQQCMTSPVVPLREQQAYRKLLTEEQLIVYYQPIINLNNGRLEKIEALARLRAEDGGFVSPQRFLPAFGQDELLMLFIQVLKQVCHDYKLLTEQGIDTHIAINFPAEGLDDPRYEKAFFEVIDGSGDMPAEHMQLEILETQDSGEITESRMTFLKRLHEAGVKIAEDDLGSGHSSLLRLDQYAFDEVKIDQGLVRGVMHNPKRAVEFILYLTRLAHAFDIPVTVEGLENTGMIEAAAILGADRGQGYGIARPMPIDELPGWYNNYVFSIHPARPKTAIGALAGYLIWDMQLGALSDRPEFISDFVGARAIVDEFIQANNLQGSEIDELLRRHHELAVEKKDPEYAKHSVRSELITVLTERWLSELN